MQNYKSFFNYKKYFENDKKWLVNHEIKKSVQANRLFYVFYLSVYLVSEVNATFMTCWFPTATSAVAIPA